MIVYETPDVTPETDALKGSVMLMHNIAITGSEWAPEEGGLAVAHMRATLVDGEVHKLGVLGLIGVSRLRLRHVGALPQLAQSLNGPQDGPLHGANHD